MQGRCSSNTVNATHFYFPWEEQQIPVHLKILFLVAFPYQAEKLNILYKHGMFSFPCYAWGRIVNAQLHTTDL